MFIILCEDNVVDRENAAQLIEEATREMFSDCHFQIFEEAESCLAAAAAQSPDIAFIDIFLGEKSGIELAEAVRKLNPKAAIIFMTISNEFASESYRVRAVDYILKPAQQDQVIAALRRCVRREDKAAFLTIRHHREILRIDQKKIEKLESQGNYFLIYMAGGEIITTRGQLKSIQSQLSTDMLKLRRGVVVNMSCIEGIKGGSCRLKSGEEIMLSRKDAGEIRQSYYNYQYNLVRNDKP
ncbi:LytTR family DNA-binding domain-containing protein [Eubacterium sp. 1001713B170207_170306_E7]|uniref:LytR/AlgR family response regulator transcription factor n=1 Tax=Eubacterium sp. 1001713B170207_170306_E7 TaxID=2787097 RepID=UPI00189849E6|nr:LytTR family DNA-binding domain-containing protein [Eubacterium sp. 1001713B170207_170306_E7]